ncbi:hypothetical protein O0L34_g4663 [Tuta absoluta]|nr:hypothetical protein O0L34_g4663 [Tuta absoluta]
MTLSTSRQQFLAYESQAPEEIHYSRRGGVFLTTCVCAALVILAVIVAALVGVIVYFITYYKLSQTPADFWDETEPFAIAGAAPDLRLPSDVVPSFYRLKIKADLESSNFTGEVYITIRAKKKVTEIVLHSKNLTIINNAKLTEQIYEKVETLHLRRKRDVETADKVTQGLIATVVTVDNNIQNETVSPPSIETTTAPVTELTQVTEQNHTLNITEVFNTVPNDESTTVSNSSAAIIETTTASTTTTTQTTTENSITASMPQDTHTQVTHSSVRNINILSITEASGDRLILTLATALKPDVDYILEIPFEGNISDSLNGFYKSTYVNANKEVKSLAVTQFEPTSARSAFPCFDEPAFKAKFEISVAHRNHLTVLSNMPVAAKEDISEQPGWQWTHFDRSVQMSTYLVAYVLCDFHSVDTSYRSKDNTTKTIKIWTRPELINKAQYAASITPRLLEYYEHVFGVPYALGKIDLIAIPDFSSGAMENWGLITFRETTLLFDEEKSVPRDKQNVAIDVAHELAHQWFGNLVTMRWWTDLWLNEGFATYIEYLGVDQIEPGWNMFESFTRDMLDLLRSDALKNTSPVSRRVVDASEIAQKFDEISYTKGANLIRMLNNTMTYELFHKGLVKYLDEWKYSNAEENDLWSAMSAAAAGEPRLSGRSLVDFMNTWTRQPGYPAVTAIRNYTTNTVTLQQQLFTSSEHPYKSTMNQLWHIPISYTTLDAADTDWSTKPKLWLTDRQTTVTLPINASQPLYINVGATGYYRVNYDHRNWELLAAAVRAGAIRSAVTTAQLIDDAFNLAKGGLLPYSHALSLSTALVGGEASRTVWDLLLSNMAFLRHNLRATAGYSYFQDYMRILLRKQLQVLNYGFTKPRDDNEAFLIESLVMWECMVEEPRCLDWARGEFDKWMNETDPVNNNPIPSYLRSLVINMGVKYGGRREFDFLWEVFQNSSDPNVKSLVITNMPSTRSEALITTLLERSLTEIPKQYAVAAWSVESRAGSQLAQRYLLDHFHRVHRAFTGIDAFMFPAVLSGAFGSIATQEELDRVRVSQRYLLDHFHRVHRAFTGIDAFMFPAVLSGAFGSIATQEELDRVRVSQRYLLDHFHRVHRAFTGIDAFMFPAVLSGAFGSIATQEELDRVRVSQRYLLDHFHRVHRAFTGIDAFMFPAVLSGAFGSIATQEELDRVRVSQRYLLDHFHRVHRAFTGIDAFMFPAVLSGAFGSIATQEELDRVRVSQRYLLDHFHRVHRAFTGIDAFMFPAVLSGAFGSIATQEELDRVRVSQRYLLDHFHRVHRAFTGIDAFMFPAVLSGAFGSIATQEELDRVRVSQRYLLDHFHRVHRAFTGIDAFMFPAVLSGAFGSIATQEELDRVRVSQRYLLDHFHRVHRAFTGIDAFMFPAVLSGAFGSIATQEELDRVRVSQRYLLDHFHRVHRAFTGIDAFMFPAVLSGAFGSIATQEELDRVRVSQRYLLDHFHRVHRAFTGIDAFMFPAVLSGAFGSIATQEELDRVRVSQRYLLDHFHRVHRAFTGIDAFMFPAVLSGAFGSIATQEELDRVRVSQRYLLDHFHRVHRAFTGIDAFMFPAVLSGAFGSIATQEELDRVRVSQRYLLDHFHRVHRAFTGIDAFMFPAVLSGAFGSIATQEELDRVRVSQRYLLDHFHRVHRAFTGIDAFMFPAVLSGAFGSIATQEELDRVRVSQRYLLDHFHRVHRAFTGIDAFMFPAVLSGAFGSIATQEELDRVRVSQRYLLDHFHRVHRAFTGIDAFMFPAVLSGAFGSIATQEELDRVRVSQRYLLDHFHRVHRAFTGIDAFMFPAVLSGAFGSIATQEELDRFKRFALEHKEKLKPMSQTLQKLIDMSQLRIGWLQRHASTINQWFKDYVTGMSFL